MNRTVPVLALIVANASSATAQTTYTIPSADTPTLQFALEAPASPVMPGDTIELTDAGFYLSAYTVDIPDLTIRGAAGQMIVVDGLGLGSVFTVLPAGSGVTFENLTITGGGNTDDGGGINAAGADITLRNCVITGNAADDDGGGINVSNAAAVIENTVISNNVLNEPNISDNGGGMNGTTAVVTIVGSTFTGNVANDIGGGLYFNGSTIDVRQSTFEGNQARGGGGLGFRLGTNGIVADCVFEGNISALDGGGIFSSASWPDFLRCRIINNEAQSDGGGITINGETTEEVDLTSCLIAGNTASGRGGGAIAQVGPDGSLINCTVVDNTAMEGGGVISVGAGAGLRVRNAIIRDNAPSQYPISATNVAFNCNISGGELANNTNVIDVDPMFVDPANGDYRLMEGSPSIDAGDAGFLNTQADPSDLDGRSRAVTADARSATGEPILGLFVDHGAFEFQPLTSADCPADQNFDGQLTPGDFNAWVLNFNAGCD